MPQPTVRSMTLGEKGLICHTLNREIVGYTNSGYPRFEDHQGFEVHLDIPDTLDIIAPEKGKLFLQNDNYRIRIERFDEERVLLVVEKKPKDSPVLAGQTLIATWLQMPFTRHLLGLNCTCPNHCPKCGAPLRWNGTCSVETPNVYSIRK